MPRKDENTADPQEYKLGRQKIRILPAPSKICTGAPKYTPITYEYKVWHYKRNNPIICHLK
jgi:hypothetical protein